LESAHPDRREIRSGPQHRQLPRIIVTAVTFAICALSVYPFHQATGSVLVVSCFLIPTVIAGAFWGKRGGLAAGVLSLAASCILVAIVFPARLLITFTQDVLFIVGLGVVVGHVADLTRRLRAEGGRKDRLLEELARSEARYRSLFDGVPVGLYRTEPSGRIVAANRALADMLGYAEIAARITIGLDLATVPLAVALDRSLFAHALREIVDNAVAATSGSGTISLRTGVAPVDLAHVYTPSAEPAAPHAFVSVQDQGLGMDRKTLDRIFEPYFTTQDFGKGAGHGLPRVNGIVSQHGGAVAVQSEPGRGTTVTLSFPLLSGSEAGSYDGRGADHG